MILSLKVASKALNTVEVYFNKKELKESLIKPIENILENRDKIYKSTIVNYVDSKDIAYYKCINLLHNKLLHNIISSNGTIVEMCLRGVLMEELTNIIKIISDDGSSIMLVGLLGFYIY